MNWQLLESSDALERLLQEKADCDVVMLDTEFMRTNTFYPKVALVQLCFASGPSSDDTAWLIDPLALDDTGALRALLTNQSVLKVLHSPSEDIEVFRHWLDVLPSPLFDTQRAAALLDRGFGLAYRALVNDICDVDLPKGETRSNWLQRPLTQSQCEYAAQDVTWLLPVWRELHEQCLAQGKLDWVLGDGQDMIATSVLAPDDAYKRVKSAGKLDQEGLAVLQRLCAWREHRARTRDKPRNWILDDKSCLQLARLRPRTRDDLADIDELPPAVVKRQGDTLLDLLQEVTELSAEQLPAALPRPLDSGQRNRLKELKNRAKEIAASLSVAPEALLAAKDYEALLREAEGQLISAPVAWQGWRAEPVVQCLRAYLRDNPA